MTTQDRIDRVTEAMAKTHRLDFDAWDRLDARLADAIVKTVEDAPHEVDQARLEQAEEQELADRQPQGREDESAAEGSNKRKKPGW